MYLGGLHRPPPPSEFHPSGPLHRGVHTVIYFALIRQPVRRLRFFALFVLCARANFSVSACFSVSTLSVSAGLSHRRARVPRNCIPYGPPFVLGHLKWCYCCVMCLTWLLKSKPETGDISLVGMLSLLATELIHV